MKRLLGVAGALASCALHGCQSPAIVRTARTLPVGAADVSVSFNVTRVSSESLEVAGAPLPSGSFTYPNVLPELIVDYGVARDLELGGRLGLATGLVELSGKYRFLELGPLHAAVGPSVGYRWLGIVYGPNVSLPLLVTVDLSPAVSLSGGPLVAWSSYDVPGDLDSGEDADLGGETAYVGGALGVELRVGKLHLMPSVELWRSLSRSGDLAELPGVHLAFVSITAGVRGDGDNGRPGPRPE